MSDTPRFAIGSQVRITGGESEGRVGIVDAYYARHNTYQVRSFGDQYIVASADYLEAVIETAQSILHQTLVHLPDGLIIFNRQLTLEEVRELELVGENNVGAMQALVDELGGEWHELKSSEFETAGHEFIGSITSMLKHDGATDITYATNIWGQAFEVSIRRLSGGEA